MIRLPALLVSLLAVAAISATTESDLAKTPLPADLVSKDTTPSVAAVVCFLEGPAVDADGNVFFSDIAGNRILKMDSKGSVTVFRADSGRTNGNCFDALGRLISCEGSEQGPGRRRIVRSDMKTGAVTVLTDKYDGKRYNSPNDVCVDSKGRVWFTDPRYGPDRSDLEMDVEGVYRVDSDGKVARVLTQEDVDRPNGIAVTPDAKTLYVIDSHQKVGGNRKIWAFAIQPDGMLRERRLVYDFGKGRGGDGMKLDVKGNLWVAAGINQPRGNPGESLDVPAGVYVISPAGKLLGRIPIPEDLITNLAFGGPARSTLYVTAGKTLYRLPVNVAGAQTRLPGGEPVAATAESTLESASGKIRQFAFDGDMKSFFVSARNPTTADHFTLVFDKPVAVKSVLVATGRPKESDRLDAGVLEISADGKTFSELSKFADGVARAQHEGRKIQALRVRPTVDLQHPVAIGEFVIESDPPVKIFQHPIEFIVDVSEAPEMKDWALNVARVCERNYAMICEELKSEDFKPRNVITMKLRKDYKGVAMASGGRITGSVKYFTDHPKDVGAMVHETVHCVQNYRTGNNPGWLVEGIADYVRFFKYEPGKLGKIRADPHYNGSYRTSAAFLAFVAEKYDKELVRKLNKTMREGEYREDVWRVLTKKSVQELDEEWRASLKR